MLIPIIAYNLSHMTNCREPNTGLVAGSAGWFEPKVRRLAALALPPPEARADAHLRLLRRSNVRLPPLCNEFLMAKRSASLHATVGILSAYVSRNSVAPADLPGLVRAIHRGIAAAGGGGAAPSIAPAPAVAINRSITPEHLICLEDGRRFKPLTRHLRTKFNLSPDQYRARCCPPTDYPMAAPSSAAAQSLHARSVGLGRGGRRLSNAVVEGDPDAQGA